MDAADFQGLRPDGEPFHDANGVPAEVLKVAGLDDGVGERLRGDIDRDVAAALAGSAALQQVEFVVAGLSDLERPLDEVGRVDPVTDRQLVRQRLELELLSGGAPQAGIEDDLAIEVGLNGSLQFGRERESRSVGAVEVGGEVEHDNTGPRIGRGRGVDRPVGGRLREFQEPIDRGQKRRGDLVLFQRDRGNTRRLV